MFQTRFSQWNPISYVQGTVTISKAASTTTITSQSPNPSAAQQAVTVGFSVAPQFTGSPTGNVTVTASSGQSCTAALAGGAGSCQLTFTTAGTPTLTAAYAGDSNFLTSTSAGVSQTVQTNVASQKLLVSNFSASGVLAFNAATGALIGPYINTTGIGLSNAQGMAFGPDGNLYVADATNNNVLRFNGTTGAFIGTFVPSSSGGLTDPIGLTFGPDKNLYVASSGQSAVLQFNGTTGAFMSVFAFTGISTANDLTFGPDGNLYAISQNNNSVFRYNGTTGALISDFIPGGNGLFGPVGLRFGPDGNLYVANRLTNNIVKFNGTTGASMGIFASGNGSGLSLPTGIAFGPDNNLYVANTGNNSVLQFNGTTGAFMSTFVPSGTGGLSSPAYLLFTAPTSPAQVNPQPFISQPPVPTAVVPGGQGLTLTVNGAGFVSGTVVNWNGTALATTFVNSDQLTATVPAADVASNGTATITVVSPAPGGGVSNVAYFEVTNSTATLSFTDTSYGTDAGPEWVVVDDLNSDGKPDLVLVNQNSNDVSVLLGNGNGTFRPSVNYAVSSVPHAVAVGDFNGDGRKDLVVAYNSSQAVVSVLLGNGDGTFQSPVNYSVGGFALSVAVGDFNGDGKADLAVPISTGYVSVLLGNGDGTFQPAVNYLAGLALSITVGDFNGDGKLDLATSNEEHTISILLGNGDGTFQPAVNYRIGNVGPGTLYLSVTAADFNGDGKLDLAVANEAENAVGVLLGNGDGTFQAEVSYPVRTSPTSIGVGDFNGDGKLDLALPSLGYSSVGVLLGNGDGTFQTEVDFPVGYAPWSVAVGDFNGDGRLDLAIADYNSNTVSILLQPVGSLTITASSATMAYGGTVPIIMPGYAGFVNGDTAASLTTQPACTTTATSSSPVGTYPTTCSGAVDPNYTISYTAGSVTITAAPLTITASSGAMVYGGAVPAITPSFSGFVNGQNSSVLTAQPACSTTATSTSPAGSSLPSTCAGAAAANYMIAYVAGTVTVSKATSTTTITTHLPNPSVVGQAVTVAFAVAPQFGGTPTGTVTVTASTGQSCSAALVAGAGSCQLILSAAGTPTITAAYSGDGNFLASSSAAVSQAVNKASTATSLASSVNPSVYGQVVTFTAAVSPQAGASGTPTGTVTFYDGATSLGAVTLGSGQAKLTTSSLIAGTHSITATYSGDGNFLASSTATALSQGVTPYVVNATLTLTNSDTNTVNTPQNPQRYSDQETFTLSVPNTTINGLTPTVAGTTVTFKVGTQTTGTCSLLNGGTANSCSITVPLIEPSATAAGAPTGTAANGQMAPGSHAVTATYAVIPNVIATGNSATLSIAPENAIATFNGDLFYGTGTATSATIVLSATIQDPAAVASVDTAGGDIRNAVVTFIDRNTGAVLCANLPVGLVSSTSVLTGSASCSYVASLGSAASVTYDVGTIVGYNGSGAVGYNTGYYYDNNTSETAEVMVAQTGPGTIAGAGYLVLTSAATGRLTPAASARQNFGFRLRYSKGGTNPQGRLNALVRSKVDLTGRPCASSHPGHATCIYQVKSTTIGSLNVGIAPSSFCPANTPSGSECASFTAMGAVNDVTIPGVSASVDNGAQVIVNLVDTHNPSTDIISFQVNASSNKGGGVWYSSDWTGTTTVEQLLGGGTLFAQ